MLFLLNPLFYSLILLFFSFLFLSKWLFTAKTKKNPPPSPPKLPVIGNLHQLGLFPHRILRALAHRILRALAQRYGPLMLLHFGCKPVLIVSSDDAAREIFKNHDLIFSNRPKSSIATKLLYGKDVAFVPYGEYWRQMKSICVMQLLSNKRVRSFHTVREEETALMIKKIEECCSSSSFSPVNLSEMFVSLTNDVVCRVALGRKYSGSEGARKFKVVLGEFVELLGTFSVGNYIPWLSWLNRVNGLDAKVEKVAKELDDFLEGVVEEHIDRQKREINGGGNDDQNKGQQDFVDVLLEIQRVNKDNYSLDKDSIKALILDMFSAGTNTTYTALEWTFTELLRHPRVMKKLQNEVRGIAGGKQEIAEADLEKMPYLKAVFKESIRLHPPAPLVIRELTQDVQVMGYDIAAGTQVFINGWAIARDPSSWEEAEEFQPERFLNTSIDFKGHDFQLIPFGAGRRSCPGILFATTVNELALASVVYKFDITLPGEERREDLDMTEASGLSNSKKYPLIVVPTPHTF